MRKKECRRSARQLNPILGERNEDLHENNDVLLNPLRNAFLRNEQRCCTLFWGKTKKTARNSTT